MNAKIMAIICAVIVVVAGAAAAVYFLNNNKDSTTPTTDDNVDTPANPLYENFDFSKTRNLMFGNANNDSYLNSDDLTMVKAFVASPSTWDINKNPLADTNADGKMTQDDVTLLQKILDATSSTAQFDVYYMGVYKTIETSKYPLSGNMCVDYSTAYDMAVILGCLDKITGTRQSQAQIDKLSDTLYPGLKSHLSCLCNDSNRFDAEKLVSAKIKIVLGDPYDVPASLKESMAKLDPSCTILSLTVNRVINDMNYTHTIVTLASLMNEQSKVQKYIAYVEDVESKILKAIEDSGATSKTMLIVYNPSSANAIGIDCWNTMKMQYTDISNACQLPFTCALPAVERYMGGMYTNLEAEYVASVNPEIIILETYNIAGSSATDAEKKATVTEKLSYINVTNAYKNNNVIVVPYEVIGGAAGISTLILMGNLVWGDSYFSNEEGWDSINYYYQNFTNMGSSVDMKEVYGYAPLKYGKDITP